MERRNWTREETLVAFNLYCRTPFGRLWGGNPEIVAVAAALGRTPGALAMKCCNLAAFDEAHQARGIKGLRNASRLDSEIWNEFQRNPEAIAFEAEVAFAGATSTPLRTAEHVEWEDVQGLDHISITKVRVNQQFFRSLVLTGYCARCAVCELPITSLLVASHIVPWSKDASLRMNPRNGICLCAIHDRAFDNGLLTISGQYVIALHPGIEQYADVPSVQQCFLRFEGCSIRLPERWHPDSNFLSRHAELIQSPAL